MSHAAKLTLMAGLALAALTSGKIEVDTLRVAGPWPMPLPLMTDTADAEGKRFDMEQALMDRPLPLSAWRGGRELAGGALPAPGGDAVTLAGFTLDCSLWAECEVRVEGARRCDVFIDGRKDSKARLLPGRHEVALRVLQRKGETDTLRVSVETAQERRLTLNPRGKRPYTFEDYLRGRRASRVELSAGGRLMALTSYLTRDDGQLEWEKRLLDLKTMRELPLRGFKQWAGRGERYVSSRRDERGVTLYEYVYPLEGRSEPLYRDEAGLGGDFCAGETRMVADKTSEGPREDPQIFQVLQPDDRIKGWRDRSNPLLVDVATGVAQPLTMGQHNTRAVPSGDGRHVALVVSENCVTERPFTFQTVLLLDPATMRADTLVRRDGFIGSVQWTADDKALILSGSPEALGGVGLNDPTGKTPSMIQTELFLLDLATRRVRPLTRDFDPNVTRWEVSRADGRVYALCENRDRKDIFRLDPRRGGWERLPLSECTVESFSLAAERPVMVYAGQSESNSDRVYEVDLRTGRERLLEDYNPGRTDSVALGECADWDFRSSRGDTIRGRYYLPPHFDPSARYPMLVYYYGGCSPTGRYLDSYYNYHAWAAQGYVVYVVQPSGCTGFGQEFAARHVNAYGEYTASDIVEGTRAFCREHAYVDSARVGCLGASYGGFMTMYLLTVTDLFRAAMSHAGISNPASYWGYGNWGYSYSAVSAAGSYPWNNPGLMSLRSPLFNADKVHTPILFLHGAADTNVPIVESTQMFNALKILGRECAFVTVEGQDHHILDHGKKLKWYHTYMAWFAKYLQDDPSWWDSLYPPKNLK